MSDTIPCKHCGKPTQMLGTKMCDSCWEVERAVRADPALARKLLGACLNDASMADKPAETDRLYWREIAATTEAQNMELRRELQADKRDKWPDDFDAGMQHAREIAAVHSGLPAALDALDAEINDFGSDPSNRECVYCGRMLERGMPKGPSMADKRDAERLIMAGTKMSNWCFNLAQRPGLVLTRTDCETMKEMQLEWDAAMSAEKGE